MPKNKRKIVSILIIIEIISMLLIYRTYTLLNNVKSVDKTVEGNKIDKTKFAMYVGKDGVYEEYNEDHFPERLKYLYNESKSYCVDSNNEKIDHTSIVRVNEDNSITVTSDKTVFCTFYFDLDEKIPDIKTFAINENKEYTTTKEAPLSITSDDEDIVSYCITTEDDALTCENWLEVNNSTNIEGTYNFENDGKYTLYAFVKDKAGNISASRNMSTTVDTIPPEIKIKSSKVQNVSLRQETNEIIVSSDAIETGSGIDKWCYKISPDSDYTCQESSEMNYIIEYSIENKTESGTISIYATDQAGNGTEQNAVSTTFQVTEIGTASNPYRIYYIEDLVTLSKNAGNGNSYEGKYVELGRDLDFQSTSSYENSERKDYGDINGVDGTTTLMDELINTKGKGFIPIGGQGWNTTTETQRFNGNFDGKGYTISNLYENVTDMHAGLFGLVGKSSSTNTFKNLTITGNITKNGTTTGHAGGLAGSSSATNLIIENVHNKVNITQNGSQSAGGIISYVNENAIINKCSNNGKITSSGQTIGGIVGFDAHKVIVLNSYNKGNISGSGTSVASGIVGEQNTGTATVINSYNNGNINVSSSDANCGIVKSDNSSTNTYVNNVYNTGSISGNTSSRNYAIFYIYRGSATILNAYYKSGQTGSNVSGTTSMTDTNMKQTNPATTSGLLYILNNNIKSISLTSIDSSLSGYTLDEWVIDPSTGYPTLKSLLNS